MSDKANAHGAMTLTTTAEFRKSGVPRFANRNNCMPADLIKKNPAARVRRFFWALCVVLGFLQAWASRMTISSDAVSYVDIGRFIWQGHWSLAVNGLWNPLYSTILGVVIGLFRPSPYWEYPLVHLVLFIIFLSALWSYDFLLQQLILLRKETESSEELSVPVWIWLCIGYTLFLWSSLRLVKVSETNPDMLVAASFYLACGFLVKIRRGSMGRSVYLALGVALGLGYLTKSIMFPVSICCLAVAFIIGGLRQRHLLASVAVFLAIAGPYIVALSLAKGRITFGDSGRYNYAVLVNRIPKEHWQGEQGDIAGGGHPLHPTRKILERPATFEFGSPVAGTYPPWTDPTYWYEGVQAPINLRRAVGTTLRLLEDESSFLFEVHGSFIAGAFVIFYTSGRKWSVLNDISTYWFLILPCLATLVMYASIHIESRYLGPFFAILLLAVFFATRLPPSSESSRLYSAVAVLMLLMFLEPLHSPSLNLTGFVRDVIGWSRVDPSSPEEVVKGMYGLGLRPGDHIASLQHSVYGMSTWACLAQVQIVSEVYYWPEAPQTIENDFWKADSATQAQVIRALAGTGAKFIVSQLPPPVPEVPGWYRVGNSDYYTYPIHPHGYL
jgi:hypothetical protein